MENNNKFCADIQKQIGKIIIDAEEDLQLRDIVGILDMTKHYFLMKYWETMETL